MVGLRTQEEDKFQQFFSIVQAHAKAMGTVFFLDCGEGREIETDQFSGEDLSGWLIPIDLAEIFNIEFMRGMISDRWNAFICFAKWINEESGIHIEFLQY